MLAGLTRKGVRRLVRDLNRLLRASPALHERDVKADGFEWIAAQDAELSLYAWLRRDDHGGLVLVVWGYGLARQQPVVLWSAMPYGMIRIPLWSSALHV